MTAEVQVTIPVVDSNNAEDEEQKEEAKNETDRVEDCKAKNDDDDRKDEGDEGDGEGDLGEDDENDDDADDDLSLGGSEGSEEDMELNAGDEADDDGDDEKDEDDDEPAKKKSKTSSSSPSDLRDSSVTSGWADAMSKILASDKQILSKAKKDKDIVMKKTTKRKKDAGEVEVVGGEGEEKGEGEEEEAGEKKEKRKTDAALKAINYGRTKPHLFEKQFERSLSRIATRGVIQLFNAVSKHQKETKDKIKKEGKSEFKKDAVLKSVSKGDFIDLLKETNTTTANATKKKKETPTQQQQQQQQQLPVTESTWKILKDDFMMTKGKSMKDWDKESDSDD